MKKLLFLAAVLLAAVSINAQIAVTCAEAVAAMPAENKATTQETYIVTGYITETNGTISKEQQCFWMDDAKGTKKTIQGYWCNLPEGEKDKALNVGDKITVTGKIFNYNNTPEIKNGDVAIIERTTTKIDTLWVSVCEAIEEGESLENLGYSTDIFIVRGRLKGNDTGKNGYHTFEMACEDKIFKPYNCKGEDGLVLGKGDSVAVIGKLYNYNGTIEISNGTVKLIEKSKEEEVILEVTVAQAVEVAMALEKGAKTDDRYAVTGFVSEIETEYSAQYHNISFYMSDDIANPTHDFMAYRVDVAEADADKVVVGAKVKVTATLQHYYKAAVGEEPEKDFAETVAGGIFELLTSAPTEQDPEPIPATCAEAVAAMPAQSGSETEDVYIVTGYVTYTSGYANPSTADPTIDQQTFYMDDEIGKKKTLQGYWCNLPGHEALNVGDKITLRGKIFNYNNTPEIKNGDVAIIERTTTKIDTLEVSVCEAIEEGESLDNLDYSFDIFIVRGRLKGIDVVNNYGQHTFKMACGDSIFKPYNCIGEEGLELGKGDSVAVTGRLYNYNGTIEISNGKVELIEKSKEEEVVQKLTVAQAVEVALALDRGAYTDDRYAVTGYVTEIVTRYSTLYHNISFYLSDELGNPQKNFMAYHVDVAETDADKVVVGAKVRVTAALQHYYKAAVGENPEQDIAETFAGGTIEIIQPAPSNAVLADYYEDGQVCVCIYVPANIACSDIVLTGVFNNWSSNISDCVKFTAIDGFDGWYATAFTPEDEPDEEKGIQAIPVMLDVDGNFNWEHKVGAVTVIRGDVQIVPGDNADEIDLINYSAETPNVFAVGAWKQIPCVVVDTVSVTEALARLKNGETGECYIKGKVSQIMPGNVEKYGNIAYWLHDIDNPNDSIQAFRMKAAGNEAYSSSIDIEFIVGDEILVYASSLSLYHNNSTDVDIPEIYYGYYVRTIIGKPHEKLNWSDGFAVFYEDHWMLEISNNENYLILQLSSDKETAIGGHHNLAPGSFINDVDGLDTDITSGFVQLTFKEVSTRGYNVYATQVFAITDTKVYTISGDIEFVAVADDYETEIDLVDDRPFVPTEGQVVTCEQARSYALSLADKTEGEITFTVEGYITDLFSDGLSFWIDDEKGNKKTFEIYKYKSLSPAGVTLAKDVKIRATGKAKCYSGTPEMVNAQVEVENVYTFIVSCDEKHGKVHGANGEYAIGTELTISAEANNGYYFVKWSDGNTDNPRTIEVTKDIELIALFDYQLTGNCGKDNALTWTFDPSSMALNITGIGSLSDNYTYGTFIESVTIGNEVTIIGSSAFAEFPQLANIIIGSSVKVLEENAFYNCPSIETITCYSQRPPTVSNNALYGLDYNTIVYVPADYLNNYLMHDAWGLYDVRPLGAMTTTVADDEVNVEPTSNTADVTWPAVENAATYELTIKDKDGNVICTLVFNANGQLTSIAFGAPGRTQTAAQVAGFTFTVTGLDSGSRYGFRLDAKDSQGEVLDTKEGTFTTTESGIATAVDNASVDAKPVKVIRDGQLFILRDGKTYTVQGAEIK